MKNAIPFTHVTTIGSGLLISGIVIHIFKLKHYLMMRTLILISALLLCGSAWSSEQEKQKTADLNQQTEKEHRGSKNSPIFINGEVTTKKDEEESRSENSESAFKAGIDRRIANYTGYLALFTFFLFVFTAALWWVTLQLSRDAKKTSDRQAEELRKIERAFVFIDGFNVELTTAADSKSPVELESETYKSCPELFITRFAIQPRWKNSGNTPTKNMSIRVNWGGPEGTIPPEYVYRDMPQKVFLAPNSTELGELVEIPSVRALVDYGLTYRGDEPMVFIWGRADYEDIFGKPHFIEWCYRIRLEDHKREGLRAGFIQWGDYNRSDE